MSNTALDHQFGGNHYIRYKMQPIELIVACEWDFIQGCVAKYILRQDAKNGKEDIEKAVHYCEIACAMYKSTTNIAHPPHGSIIDSFVRINELSNNCGIILKTLDRRNFMAVMVWIKKNYNI